MNRLNSFTKPVVIAHRGACAYAPENTLSAFKKAIEQGADGIEFDVKLTKDGHVVIMHDPTLERTTNGSGRVMDHTLAELKMLDAGAHFSPEFTGEPVPTLRDVLETVGDRLYLNIELTNYAAPLDALPVKVAQVIKDYAFHDNILFSSFNLLTLLRIRRLLPHIPVAVLALPGIPGIPARGLTGRLFAPDIVHPYYKDVTPAYVQRQKKLGRRVHVWTVNDPHTMLNLFHFGVQGIITDDPVLALQRREQA